MTRQEIENAVCKQELYAFVQLHAAIPYRRLVLEACGDDFALLWPEHYRENEKRKVSKTEKDALTGCKCMRGVQIRRNMPNAELVEKMRTHLSSMSKEKLSKAAKELIKILDMAGCLNAILFIDNPKTGETGVLLHRIVERYAIANPEAYKEQLWQLKEYRNKDLSHVGEGNEASASAGKATHTVDTTIQQLKTVEANLALYRNTQSKELSDALKYCEKESKRIQEKLSIPPINIEEFAAQNELSIEDLKELVNDSQYLRSTIDDEGKTLLFVTASDLRTFYNGYVGSDKQLKQEQKLPGRIREDVPAVAAVSLRLPQLARYQQGMLTAPQVKELVSQFNLVLDRSAMLNADVMTVVKDLGPTLKANGSRLLVDFAALSDIYRVEKNSESQAESAAAKKARLQLYHMQHQGMVAYVGDIAHSKDTTESLLQFLHNRAEMPMCVICTDRSVAERLADESLPNCICMTNWKADGLMVRSAYRERLAELSAAVAEAEEMPDDAPEGSAEATDAAQPVSAAPTAPAAPLSIPADQSATVDAAKDERKALLYPDLTVPRSGETVQDEGKNQVRLGKIIGEPGGEGTVYETNLPGTVAKIYHANRITGELMDKLRAMKKVQIGSDLVCWPKQLLFTKAGQFVGFLMPAAPNGVVEMGLSVYKLAGPTIQERVLPGWNRLSVAIACQSVCKTFSLLHKQNVLMGDVNPRNLLVLPSDPAKVYFVDCDSYQFEQYNCPVGMAEYSSPEFLKRLDRAKNGYAECPRTKDDEDFALASLLFHMLMLGQTPFAAKNKSNIDEVIRSYSFAYRTKENRGDDVPDGPYALIWNNTPPIVKDKFADVFTGKRKVDANEWEKSFGSYIYMIRNGRSTDELLPTKYYDATGDFFEDFECCGCHRISNKPKEAVAKLRQFNQPILCNSCMMMLQPLKDIPEIVRCDICHNQFTATRYDKALQELGKKCKCNSCRAKGNAGRTVDYRPRQSR